MDKKLNEVTKVTDMAYVPVIMADGSIGQIAKSDLASVVAGILNPGYVNKFNVKPSENGYVKLYTTKANGNSCALITLHRYNNRPMAVICVYLHPERTDDTLVCKYIIGEKNSTSYDLNLYYTANSDGSYSIYSTHTYFYPSSVSFLLNYNTIVNNEAISSLPSGATEANIVHDVFGYNSVAELSAGVANNDLTRIKNIKGKRMIKIGWCGVWSQGSFIASVSNSSGLHCGVLGISYRHMNTVQYVTHSCTSDGTVGIEIYKKLNNNVLEVYIYSTTDQSSVNPLCGMSTHQIEELGIVTDLSSYTLVASL